MVAVLEETQLPIQSDTDVLLARQQGRQMAAQMSLSVTDQVATATAISELARNILLYAKAGEILLRRIEHAGKLGIMVIARDRGPGIADVTRVLQGGYSTSGGLGLGLSGSKRLMDEFEIMTSPGDGTTVTVKKWQRSND